MKPARHPAAKIAAMLLAAGFSAGQAWGCATCFGRSDSPLAEGMNMGILVLLGVILSVLAGLATFFVFLGRRAARCSSPSAAAPNLSR